MSQAIQSSPPQAAPARISAGAREVRQTAILVVGAIAFGLVAQAFLPESPWINLGIVTVGALALVGAGLGLPGKLDVTISGFRFTATLLVVLALAAVLGTLVLQHKPMAFYETRYASVAGIIGFFHLDDMFHSMWFMSLLALFVAGLLTSSIRRMPITTRNLGFHLCHIGLIVSLLGAGLSATLAVHARVNLHVGEEATAAMQTGGGGYVMETGPDGRPEPRMVPLGFGVKLDDFGIDRYRAEYLLTFYEPDGNEYKMRASFDPVVGERHRLSGGAAFTVDGYYPDFYTTQKLVPSPDGTSAPRIETGYATRSQKENNPAVLVSLTQNGRTQQALLMASKPGALRTASGAALTFERRHDEVKTYKSTVTAAGQGKIEKAEITVNSPLSFKGWTLYQANYDPRDPSYSGLDAVKDPGVPWVFTGFALLSFGVFYIFNVQPRLRRKKAES